MDKDGKPPSAFDALIAGARAAAKKARVSLEPSSPKCAASDDAIQAPNSDGTSGWLRKKKKEASDSPQKIVRLMHKVELLKSPMEDFEPRLVVCWDDGEKVPFIFLCLAFEMISSTAKTSLKMRTATNMLWAVMEFGAPGDLLVVLYLSAYQISPINEGGSDLGIGESCVSDLLAEVYGKSLIKEQYASLGDLGLVSKKARSSQTLMCSPNPLTVSKVVETFWVIAKEFGEHSIKKKKNHIKALLVAACHCEPKCLIRLFAQLTNIYFFDK